MENSNTEDPRILYKTQEWYEDQMSRYQYLQCLVLTFYLKLKNEPPEDIILSYKSHFSIERRREGSINGK